MQCCGSGLDLVSDPNPGFPNPGVGSVWETDQTFGSLAALSTRSCRYMYLCDTVAVYPMPSQTGSSTCTVGHLNQRKSNIKIWAWIFEKPSTAFQHLGLELKSRTSISKLRNRTRESTMKNTDLNQTFFLQSDLSVIIKTQKWICVQTWFFVVFSSI